jgi:hypothetical protein
MNRGDNMELRRKLTSSERLTRVAIASLVFFAICLLCDYFKYTPGLIIGFAIYAGYLAYIENFASKKITGKMTIMKIRDEIRRRL